MARGKGMQVGEDMRWGARPRASTRTRSRPAGPQPAPRGHRRRLLAAVALVANLAAGGGPARADSIDLRPAAARDAIGAASFAGWEQSLGPSATRTLVTQVIHQSAELNGLPVPFMLRLLDRESGFDPNAVSRAGAAGIAQFMPATAQAMGLADPFDPLASVTASGRYLGLLRRQFGNLGLAAAAYNAEPGRVQQWLVGRSALPAETLAYVRAVTGRPVLDFVPPGLRESLRLGDPIPGAGFGLAGWEGRVRADLLNPPAAPASARPTAVLGAPAVPRGSARPRTGRPLRGEAALCEAMSQNGAACTVRATY